MRTLQRVALLVALLAGPAGPALAQTTVLSNGTGGGDWALAATWQGGIVPTSLDSVVIQGSDSVFVTSPAVCSGLQVVNGGRVALYAKLSPTTVQLFGLAVVHADSLRPSGAMTVGNGGTYQHNVNAGRIPTATWAAGSTVSITGATANSPASGNQSFHHVVWNCPAQTANLNMGWDSITIGGNITVLGTGTGRWQMCAPTAGDSSTVTILGNIIQSGGNFTTHGTSNALTIIRIHHYGSISITGGNFSLTRGSQSGTGQTIWYLYQGDVTLSNATTQNSNSGGYARFLFLEAGTQSVELSNVTFGGGGMPIEVVAGTTLNMGTSVIRGSGAFTLNAGAVLETGVEGGLDSTLAGTGTKTLSAGAGYTFNGVTAQVTGTLLPATVNALTIDNPSGVSLTDTLVVSGVLGLSEGLLQTGVNTLEVAAGGSVTRTSGWVAGSLLKTVPVLGGAGSQTWEIGDAAAYTPVVISGTTYASPFGATVFTTAGDHPNLTGSGIDAAKSVNRFYTITGTPSGASDVTFTFVPADVDAGANTAAFVVGKYDAPNWTQPSIGVRTPTTTQATGITGFSDFAIGEPPTVFPLVTFRVNMKAKMQEGTFLPDSGDVVTVRGGFNDWGNSTNNPDTLTDGDNDSIFVKTLALAPSTNYEYKFWKTLRGGLAWEDGVSPNRAVLVGTADTTLPAPYFNNDGPSVPVTFQVNMSVQMLEGKFLPDSGDVVKVRGSFNGWGESVAFADVDADSIYTGVVPVGSDRTIDYKFYKTLRGGLDWENSIGNRQFFIPLETPTVIPADFFDKDSVASLPGFLAVPGSIAFGGVTVGDSASQTVWVFNTGLGTLTISAVGVPGVPEFTADPASGAIAAGDSLLFTVKFKPVAAVAYGGNLEFTHDAAGSPGVVTLSGTGLPAGPSPKFLSLSQARVFDENPLKPGKSNKPAKRAKLGKPITAENFPNWSNLLSEVTAQGGFQPGTSESDSAGGAVIGVSYMFLKDPIKQKWAVIKDSVVNKHWVRLTKWDFKKSVGKSYNALQKTLYDKILLLHDGAPRGLDFTTDGKNKPLKGQYTKLTPKKHDNALLGEMVALKVNIAASALGTTPAGYGDLLFNRSGHQFDGLSVAEISARVDSGMTLFADLAYTQEWYDSALTAVKLINEAFLGPIDTVQFNQYDLTEEPLPMILKGQVELDDVPYLSLPTPFAPVRIARTSREVEAEEDLFEDEEFEDGEGVPVAAKLYQNYPNPFNPATTIAFNLREEARVTIRIFDLLGREVATLVAGEELEEGMQQVVFDAGQLSSGLYFYQIDAEGLGDEGLRTVSTQKMMLLK